MDRGIRISRTWIVIILVGLSLFTFGFCFHREFLEVIGILSSSGAFVCGITGVGLRIFRRYNGERFK